MVLNPALARPYLPPRGFEPLIPCGNPVQVVGREGLEPSILTEYGPKPYASTSCATCPPSVRGCVYCPFREHYEVYVLQGNFTTPAYNNEPLIICVKYLTSGVYPEPTVIQGHPPLLCRNRILPHRQVEQACPALAGHLTTPGLWH